MTAASYEVRPYGVRSGMSAVEAHRLAPHAIFLPTRHSTYSPYAARVKEVLERYAPEVRTASIDEFFLDFRGCAGHYRAAGDADDDATIERTVREMRQAIQDEVGLPASAGIGTTKCIAKIASGLAKPAGVLLVRAGGELDFVRPLPVRKFPGIGPVAELKLHTAGVETLGQLLALPAGATRMRLRGLAASVLAGAQPRVRTRLGRDRPAFHEHDPVGLTVGTISNERTFRQDLSDPRALGRQLRALSERVCWRARSRGIRARTVTVKMRYADFETLTRARTLPPTNAEARVLACCTELLEGARTRPLAIRLLGVQLSNLVLDSGQLDLPFDPDERPALGAAIDAVRDRFGYDAIRLGVAGGSTSWLA